MNPTSVADMMKIVWDHFIKYKPLEALLQPKRISPPGGYHAVYHAAALAHDGLLIAKTFKKEDEGSLRMSVVTACYMIINEGMPIYYIADDFIRAVAATELPTDVKIEDLHWPRQAMCLSFPRQFMIDYLGQDISYVTLANVKPGEYRMPGYLTTVVPTHKMCVHTCIWNKRMNRPENAIVAWWQADFLREASQRYAYTDVGTDSPPDMLPEKKELNDKLGNLVLKLLMVLNLRSTYVVEGGIERQEKRDAKGRIEQRELWAPNIIGGVYRMKGQKGARHASHTGLIFQRRGHITHQIIGGRHPNLVSSMALPRLLDGEIDWSKVEPVVKERFWKQHKRIWVEPIYKVREDN